MLLVYERRYAPRGVEGELRGSMKSARVSLYRDVFIKMPF
jgi:hypothetical protein